MIATDCNRLQMTELAMILAEKLRKKLEAQKLEAIPAQVGLNIRD
jgi:hypothetical protein